MPSPFNENAYNFPSKSLYKAPITHFLHSLVTSFIKRDLSTSFTDSNGVSGRIPYLSLVSRIMCSTF